MFRGLIFKKPKMIKSGFFKNKKYKIFLKQSNTISLHLFIKQGDLLSLISFMNLSIALRIMHFGIKLQEQKDFSGWLIILNFHSLFKKQEQEYIIN